MDIVAAHSKKKINQSLTNMQSEVRISRDSKLQVEALK
jgi:hypothetical protein